RDERWYGKVWRGGCVAFFKRSVERTLESFAGRFIVWAQMADQRDAASDLRRERRQEIVTDRTVGSEDDGRVRAAVRVIDHRVGKVALRKAPVLLALDDGDRGRWTRDWIGNQCVVGLNIASATQKTRLIKRRPQLRPDVEVRP